MQPTTNESTKQATNMVEEPDPRDKLRHSYVPRPALQLNRVTYYPSHEPGPPATNPDQSLVTTYPTWERMDDCNCTF